MRITLGSKGQGHKSGVVKRSKLIFGRSRILTPIAAICTAPMYVNPPCGGKAAMALWMQCGFSGIVCGLSVDFWWPVNTWLRVGVLEARDGGAVGLAWSFPSGLPFGPLRALIEHFRL